MADIGGFFKSLVDTGKYKRAFQSVPDVSKPQAAPERTGLQIATVASALMAVKTAWDGIRDMAGRKGDGGEVTHKFGKGAAKLAMAGALVVGASAAATNAQKGVTRS